MGSRKKQTEDNTKEKDNKLSESTRMTIIVAIIGLLGTLGAAYLNYLSSRPPIQPTASISPPSATPNELNVVTETVTPLPVIFSPTETATLTILLTPTPSPTLTLEDQLVQLIDNYYTCINIANPGSDRDYEVCWNLLSDYPGEYQSHLNKNDFKSTWKKYKVTYALYYCSKYSLDFVDAKYYLYDRNDLSLPIGNGEAYYLEYSFGLDENGWRIKGGDLISGIGSYCERQPRIEKLTLIP